MIDSEHTVQQLRESVEEVADFPTPGVNFLDITPLLMHPYLLQQAIHLMAEPAKKLYVDKVLVIESRGFLFGAPMAFSLNTGMILARKPGKLPRECVEVKHNLEYGSSMLQMHCDSVKAGDRVLVVDDVLATGGTAEAAGRLVTDVGGEVAGYCFLIELLKFPGRNRLQHENIWSILEYEN